MSGAWLRKGNGHSLCIDKRTHGEGWMVFFGVPAGSLSFTVPKEKVEQFVAELSDALRGGQDEG